MQCAWRRQPAAHSAQCPGRRGIEPGSQSAPIRPWRKSAEKVGVFLLVFNRSFTEVQKTEEFHKNLLFLQNTIRPLVPIAITLLPVVSARHFIERIKSGPAQFQSCQHLKLSSHRQKNTTVFHIESLKVWVFSSFFILQTTTVQESSKMTCSDLFRIHPCRSFWILIESKSYLEDETKICIRKKNWDKCCWLALQ